MTSEFTVVWYDRPNLTVGSTDSSQGLLRLVKGKSSPVPDLQWPRAFQEVKVPRLYDDGTGW